MVEYGGAFPSAVRLRRWFLPVSPARSLPIPPLYNESVCLSVRWIQVAPSFRPSPPSLITLFTRVAHPVRLRTELRVTLGDWDRTSG